MLAVLLMGLNVDRVVAMFNPHPGVRRPGYIRMLQILGQLVPVAPTANRHRKGEKGENTGTEELPHCQTPIHRRVSPTFRIQGDRDGGIVVQGFLAPQTVQLRLYQYRLGKASIRLKILFCRGDQRSSREAACEMKMPAPHKFGGCTSEGGTGIARQCVDLRLLCA